LILLQVSDKIKLNQPATGVTQYLTNAFIPQLENELKLPADTLSLASKKVAIFVQNWLDQTDGS